MNILLCGASGFVGRHLKQQLQQAGHTVVCAQRTPEHASDIAVDYVRDTRAEVWRERVKGMDVLINAVGVLRDSPRTPMQAVFSDTPKAMFDACVLEGVPQVIQISALGAGGALNTAYMRCKGEADAHLLTLPLNATIFRPSVVYGADGAAAKMFRLLARLPILFVPGQGESLMQPVHIDDIAAAVCQRVNQPQEPHAKIISAVGPQVLSYREMIATYRAQLSSHRAWVIPLPWPVMGLLAKLGQWLPQSPLDPDTLAMLRAGSVGDGADFAAVLGRAPRHPNTFLSDEVH